MESKHGEPIKYFTKLETEINKTVHAATNCRSFTKAFGKAMDVHLRKLRIHRKLTTRWLNLLDIPNKDELAAISLRMVEFEEKLDQMDETIYFICKTQSQNQKQLNALRKLLEELLVIFRAEAKEMQERKLQSLKSDLEELQQLFYQDCTELEE